MSETPNKTAQPTQYNLFSGLVDTLNTYINEDLDDEYTEEEERLILALIDTYNIWRDSMVNETERSRNNKWKTTT